MGDESKTDLFMKFTLQGGAEVAAECALDIAKVAKFKEDPFMDGFRAAPYQDYSNFFRVLDFGFGLKANENELDNRNGGHPSSRVAGSYARWRSLSDQQVREQAGNTDPAKMFYPVEFDEFSFTRLIDSASPIFFQCCCNSVTFESAALVKRVSRGDGASLGYLRLDFKDVLITKVNWDDGDVVKENCTCISRHCRVLYKPQKADGTLQGVMPDPRWDQDPRHPASWPRLS